MPSFRLAAQRDHLVGIDPNFFEVCSPAMDTHSILRLSRSNALDLLKLATLALHPLVDGFHFCYQHGYLLRSLLLFRQSVLQGHAASGGGMTPWKSSSQSLCGAMVSGGCVCCCRCPRTWQIVFGSKLHIRSEAPQNGFSTEHLIFFTVGLHPANC